MPFSAAQDPLTNLDVLVKEAAAQGIKDANGMALATVGKDQKPSVRTVLYKGLLRGGLSFYTNYEGRKAQELAQHKNASVCFFWARLDQQIRVEGVVEKLTRQESEAYFRTRARLSQAGAWASHQSEEISGPEILQQRLEAVEKKYAGQEIPCPPNWGGYHLIPNYFEFWFGRQGRLHDRYCYEKQGGVWRQFMRSP